MNEWLLLALALVGTGLTWTPLAWLGVAVASFAVTGLWLRARRGMGKAPERRIPQTDQGSS